MATTFAKSIREQVGEFVRLEREKNPSADSNEILQLLISDFQAVSGRRRTVVAPENLCMARVWAGGKGGQCHKAKMDGSDYCKKCAKDASICSTPASFLEDGKHKGLFWGRVDEPLPMKSADGKGLAIMWRTEDGREKARSLLESGECAGWHPFCTQPQFRTRKWDAPLNTTLPRLKGAAKKPKKTKSKRVQTAKQRWMAENRSNIQDQLETLAIKTQKAPKCLVAFIVAADFDSSKAEAAIQEAMADDEAWSTHCEDNGPFENDKFDIAEDGSFTGELTGTKRSQMLLGPVSKTCTEMWKALSDEEKAPFVSAYEDAKAQANAELSDSEDPTKAPSSESEEDAEPAAEKPKTKKPKKSAKKKKKKIVKPPTPPPTPTPEEDEEEEEEEEVEVETIEDALYKGKKITIYVDEDDTAYDADSNELGEYNRETNTVE